VGQGGNPSLCKPISYLLNYVRVTFHEAPKEIFTTQVCEVSLILLEEAWPINNIAFSPMTTIAYCFQHLWKREKVDK